MTRRSPNAQTPRFNKSQFLTRYW